MLGFYFQNSKVKINMRESSDLKKIIAF